MGYAEQLDPSESVLAFYATDLRRTREKAGITQRDFAKRALMAPSLLNKIEAARRLPSRELSELCDEVFGTGDHFQRLWPLVVKYAYPSWFRPYVELEEAATVIRSFQAQLVPGLLQTVDYARAVLTPGRQDPDKVDELVTGRLERQRILTRAEPPELWVILDENVLRRPMGGTMVMCEQLERLVAVAFEPRTVIQVVPYDAGAYAGVDGSFVALTLDEGSDVVYTEGFLKGQILAEPEEIKAADRAYDLLRAVALSPDRSIDLITDVMEELRP